MAVGRTVLDLIFRGFAGRGGRGDLEVLILYCMVQVYYIWLIYVHYALVVFIFNWF